MTCNEYKAKVNELESLFDNPEFKQSVSCLLAGLRVSNSSGTWCVYEDRDRNSPAMIPFDNEDACYDWLFDRYILDYTTAVSRMDFFIELKIDWFCKILSQNNNKEGLKHYILRDGPFDYNQIKKNCNTKELLFIEDFSYESYPLQTNLDRILFECVKKIGNEYPGYFEDALIDLLCGDNREFFLGYMAVSSHVTARNAAKKYNKYYFDIDIEKVVNCLKTNLQAKKEQGVENIEINLTDTYSIDMWATIEKFDGYDIKYSNYSLLNCEDPKSLYK